MKHIFKNEIKHLLSGGTIKGLSIDSFMFFLDSLSGKHAFKKILIIAKEPMLSHFVRHKGFFKNNLYCFPKQQKNDVVPGFETCLLYTSPSPRDATLSRMPSSA